ncbi:MAG: sigma-70 family RNA polymerase sigma factor [Proteobacteria bacterium]|nr:sigma-70 family RNA polymerase sigma factor [Pseudomonadota bacterium]
MLPHGAAAYNLARWLCRNEADARDIVQESFARALQYFSGFRGGDARSWLLAVVRNTARSWLKSKPPMASAKANSGAEASWQDEAEPLEAPPGSGTPPGADPLHAVISDEQARELRQAVMELPVEHREVLVLREFEDLAYRDIAAIVGCPIGTVMSRLARARDALAARLREEARVS